MALSGQVHNSRLKQKNKKHKTIGHKSKRYFSAESKGRVSAKVIAKNCKKDLNKEQRRHQANQIRANKREESIYLKRQLGTETSPPFLVTIVPLSLNINPKTILHYLIDLDESSVSKYSEQGIAHLSCARLKQRFSFVVPPIGDLYSILDVAKVSDTVLFVWKAGEEIHDAFNMIIASLLSQGFPSVFHAVDGEEDLPSKKVVNDDLDRALKNSLVISEHSSNKGHKKVRMLKDLQMDISSKFPGNFRPFFLNKIQEVNLLLRQIGSVKRRNIFYRDQRSHIVAEKVSFEGEGSTGTLKLQGYIRCQPLSVNKLIHIPGWGEFQLSQMDLVADPFPLEARRRQKVIDGGEEPRPLDVPDPRLQETLDSIYEVDPLSEDQTWPTEEEIKESLAEFKKIKQKGPRGCSSYQSSWLLDDDKQDDESEDATDDEDMMDDICPAIPFDKILNSDEEDCADDGDEAPCSDDEDDRTTLTEIDDEYDDKMDYDEEMEYLQKIKAAREDAAFPDEIDTPVDISARVRFQKYRGLESFHSSPWNLEDDLPLEFKKILHLKSFMHTKKSVLKEERDGALPGWYVMLHIKDVPKYLYLDHVRSQSPFVAFSLLSLEQKMSIVHIVLNSHTPGHYHPIKSKERLIFHVGFRRFANCPIFSEHSSGNKYKFLRFFKPGETVVATMYAPILFPPCPVTVYRPRPDGSQELVASGSLIYPNPNRVICKKVVLSGHPFKISPRYAVIRYMFFSREDITFFKNILLRTKLGRRGHIIEPIGTHGHMKCTFDKQLQSQDTVVMDLYKRVFPKWRFDPIVPRPLCFYAGVRSRIDSENSSCESQIEQKAKKKKVTFF